MEQINIIFIHGLLANKNSNIALEEYCIKNNFNYYSLDLPGHGEEPFNDIDLHLDAYIDFVLNFININNIKKPILVGHSLVGPITVGLISKMNKEDRSLVILEDPIKQSIIENIKPGKIESYVFDVGIFLKKIKDISKYMFKNFNKIRQLLANSTSNESLIFLWNCYRKIDIPTLVIFGEKDKLLNQESSVKNIKGLNKDIEFSIIKEARHTPNVNDPESFINSINDFLIKNKIINE